jgi:tight adherence protein B
MNTFRPRPPRPMRWIAALAASVVALGLFAGLTTSAGAAGGDALQIRQVDTTQPGSSTMQFLYTGDASDVRSALVSDNGTEVASDAPQVLAQNEKIAIALVFDTSDAMDSSGALVAAKEAAVRWIQGRSEAEKANQLVGVYTSNATPDQVQSLTSDTTRIVAAIQRVSPPADAGENNTSAMWGAIALAGNDLADKDGYQSNIVMMTGTGANTGASRSTANGAVVNSGASIFAVELLGQGMSPGSLDSMVRANGGLVFSTQTGTDLGDLVTQVGTTIDDQQFSIGFEAATEAGSVANLDLTVGDQNAKAAVVVGSEVIGATSLAPDVTTSAGGISFLQGPIGMILLIGVVLIAAIGLAYGVIMIFVREDRLSTALQPYDDALAGTSPDTDEEDGLGGLARTALVQRAVALTEQVAEQRGILSRTEAALERANLPLRAGEALFFYASIVVVATLLSLVVTGSVILGLIVGLVSALLPVAIVSFLAGRRRKQFMGLLPDTLSLLAGTLRAGYSLMQGVEAVSQEVSEPMGLELRRVVTEARLGRPLEEALDGVAERMASPDFAWAVMAIRIQREVGGNLSELLLTVAETMIQRERLRRDVAALTAEGRMSAYVLIALPIGLGLVMFVMNKEYTSKLLDTTAGNIMLGAAVISAGIGYLWMRKIINIKI